MNCVVDAASITEKIGCVNCMINYYMTIWILGCSFVVGTAVEPEQNFVSLLSQRWSVKNLGIEGAGPERVWQQYCRHQLKSTADHVVFCWPSLERSYTVYQGEMINLGPWLLDQDTPYVKQYRTALLNNTVRERNLAVIARAQKTVQNSSHVYIEQLFENGWLDWGSDGVHPGPVSHKRIAEHIDKLLTARLGPAATTLQ